MMLLHQARAGAALEQLRELVTTHDHGRKATTDARLVAYETVIADVISDDTTLNALYFTGEKGPAEAVRKVWRRLFRGV